MRRGLLLSPPEPEHWLLGGVEPVINPSGDWTPWKPSDEQQKKQLFDSNGCALFGTGHALVTLAKFHGFNDFPTDVSERYMGVVSGTTPKGTDPHLVAENIRKPYGLVPASLLPWSDDLDTYFEYYAPNPMESSILSWGASFLNKFEVNHRWVFPFGSSYTPKQKAELLEQALKVGTVCVSLDGAYRTRKGRLAKTPGTKDNHWAQLVRPGVIFDQYEPFEKELEKNYDHSAAKVYFITRKPVANKNIFDMAWDILMSYFHRYD